MKTTNVLLLCDKQLPGIMEPTRRTTQEAVTISVFNYSKMYIEKSSCLVCLLLISVPLGLLSRTVTSSKISISTNSSLLASRARFLRLLAVNRGLSQVQLF